MNRPRILGLPVLLAAAALVTSGCAAQPGSAAVVGSDRIAASQLDDVAGALCAAQSGSAQQSAQPQELVSRAARQGALDVLINGALSRQFGASRGVAPDQEQISSALAANQQTIDSIPAASRSVFRDTLRGYAEGQLMLVEIGKAELAKRGTANATDQQAIAAGTQLRNAWVAKHVSVKVDPRYGHFVKGALRAGSGSLSTPVSAAAVNGAKAQPPASWVSSLPASQKCG